VTSGCGNRSDSEAREDSRGQRDSAKSRKRKCQESRIALVASAGPASRRYTATFVAISHGRGKDGRHAQEGRLPARKRERERERERERGRERERERERERGRGRKRKDRKRTVADRDVSGISPFCLSLSVVAKLGCLRPAR